MAKQYKVWISVEEYDPATEKYEELDSNAPSVATFDNEAAAQGVVKKLTEIGSTITRGHPDLFHPKLKYGLCPICGHSGSDCTGEEEE